MSLIKSRRRIKNANGEYDIVYHETSTDLVRHNDGNTVADHMNGKLASTDGVHGFRYNETDKTFESYDSVNDTWSKVGSPMFAFAEEYSAESVYAIGEYCIKDGALYKANQAITIAEEWTDSHWTETSVATELEAISTTLQKKADLGADGKVPGSQVDAYSKADSISAETRTALSLAETATPDAALAEIARQLSERGGVKLTKQWENASPRSSFDNQVITLDLGDYDFVILVHHNNTADANIQVQYVLLAVGDYGLVSNPTGTNGIAWRSFAVTTAGFNFSSCSDTKRNVPLLIYGVKGISITT